MELTERLKSILLFLAVLQFVGVVTFVILLYTDDDLFLIQEAEQEEHEIILNVRIQELSCVVD